MEKTVLHVEGMSCEHCVLAVTTAVEALPGIAGVSVDLPGKTVTVDHDPAKCPIQAICQEIEAQGFEIED